MYKNNYPSVFPNITETVASYDFVSMSIFFDKCAQKEYLSAKEYVNTYITGETSYLDLNAFDVLGVMYHEYRHWFDSLFTLWGREKLTTVFQAMTAVHRGNEKKYHYVHDMYSSFWSDTLLKYYTTTYNNQQKSQRPWKHEITLGQKFDHRGVLREENPILFLRFSDAYDNLLARAPLTILSLLELNSVSEEVSLLNLAVETSKNRDNKTDICTHINEKYVQNMFYEHNLVEYNVALHFFSNEMSCSDPLLALHQAARLSELVLNFPLNQIKKLKCPTFLKGNEKFHDYFLENSDLPYVYALLVSNYAHVSKQKFLKTKHFLVNDVLLASGIIDIDEFERDYLNTKSKQHNEIPDVVISVLLKYILSEGNSLDLLKMNDENVLFAPRIPQILPSIHKNIRPNIFFNDTDSIPNKLSSLSAWYTLTEQNAQQCDDFIEICR
jgi:hypothetical protein